MSVTTETTQAVETVFPINCSPQDQPVLDISAIDRLILEKTAEFTQNGFCVIDDVICTHEIDSFRGKAMDNYQEIRRRIIPESGHRFGVGIRNGFKEIVQRHENRYEMPYRMTEIGSLMYADTPIIKRMVSSILGAEYHIPNVSLVLSDSGAMDQGWHADGPHMSVEEVLPCHCLNVFIPLVDVTAANGPTSFRPESHHMTIDLKKKFLAAFMKKTLKPVCTPELRKGSILLFDYRVLHRGTANTTAEARPILVLTFGKTWYQVISPQ